MTQRHQALKDIAARIESMIRAHGRRNDIKIRFTRIGEGNINRYTDFQREYHGIISGDEYFMIDDPDGLLYAVNVSGDSNMTAAAELMELVSRKAL
jgi:hypothetical protein